MGSRTSQKLAAGKTNETTTSVIRIEAILSSLTVFDSDCPTLLLTRNDRSAAILRTALAARLGCDENSLDQRGILVQSRFAPWVDKPCLVAIATGYFGLTTFDSLMATRASEIHLVLDPIEARTAWFGLNQIRDTLSWFKALDAVRSVQKIADSIARHAARFSDVFDLSFAPIVGLPLAPLTDLISRHAPLPNEIAVLLTDGTRLDVRKNARFEVLGSSVSRLRTVPANELKPGDEIVLLREDYRASFSEKLLATIDGSTLANEAQQRFMWLSIARSIYEQQKPNLRRITERMAETGHPVDYATVRSWLGVSDEDAAIPERADRFLAFAQIMGISLPEGTLIEMYSAIRKLRINHRRIGRELARVIRGVRLGRLGAPTLARIEREWGFSARELLESARVGTVDEVLLPEEEINHASHCS